jgi:hypothetical protein
LDREQFIETQAAFQLGTLDPRGGTDVRDWVRAENPTRINLTYHDPRDKSFVPEACGSEIKQTSKNVWKRIERGGDKPALTIRALRNADFLCEAYAAGIAAPFVVDMQDAVRKPNMFPCFQYNRHIGTDNAVLWPHRRVHLIGAKEFCAKPDPSESALSQKQPVVFWRGSLRGFSTLGGTLTNFRAVVKQFREQKIDKEQLLAHLETVPRYAFVTRYFGMPGFDIGFVQPPDLVHYFEIPEIARYQGAHAPPNAQRNAKYLISIQGTDVGTSFGWQIATNSVVMKEANSWEVFFDCHLRPWEHFVPVARDFSDIAEKIAWSEANADACRQMAEKRHRIVGLLLEQETRDEALRRVIARYNEFYRGWAALRP